MRTRKGTQQRHATKTAALATSSAPRHGKCRAGMARFPHNDMRIDSWSKAGARRTLAMSRRTAYYGHKGNIMAISEVNVRNQFRGKIKEIIFGPVVSEVDVETPHGIVTSVITSRSIKDLDLKVGSEVIALVKSTEVSIAKIQ